MTPHETMELIQKYLDDANGENATGTHRGVVLVWASIIDDMLMRMLQAHFVDMNSEQRNGLYGPMGPLGGFSNRTKALRALGIIHNDEVNLIDAVRSIRNKFAHNVGITLNDDEIKEKCKFLSVKMTSAHEPEDPKMNFIGGCGPLMMLLANRLSRITRSQGVMDDRDLPERAYGVPHGTIIKVSDI